METKIIVANMFSLSMIIELEQHETQVLLKKRWIFWRPTMVNWNGSMPTASITAKIREFVKMTYKGISPSSPAYLVWVSSLLTA